MASREIPIMRLRYSPAEKGARVRRLLAKIDGLAMDTGYSGQYVRGPVAASVRIEGGGFIDVRQRVSAPPPAVEAIAAHAALAGNVRFAVVAGQTSLVADTWLDGHAHLAASLGEIGDSFQQVIDRSWRSPRRAECVNPDRVAEALRQPPWDAESVVRLDDGWELRPRLHGEAAPLRLSIETTRVRLAREVLSDCPDEHRPAVAMQSLFGNGQWRFARLSLHGRAIVAETSLHAGLIDPVWLAHAARAVAVAAVRCQPTLEILARQPDAAYAFSRMFLSSTPSAAERR